MVFALLFGGVELWHSKRECLLSLRHAFARGYTAVTDLNAVLFVAHTRKNPPAEWPVCGWRRKLSCGNKRVCN